MSTYPARVFRSGARFVSSVSAIGAAGVGGLFGIAVLTFDRADWPSRNVEFARTGSFLLWAFVIVAQTAIWPIAVGWLWPDIRALGVHFRRNGHEIVESLLALSIATWVGVISAAFGPRFPHYLPHHREKLLAISAAGWVAGSIAACGIWLIHGALKELCSHDPPRTEDFEELLLLREKLQRFLFVTGASVGLAILGAGAERNMITAYNDAYGGPGGFPIEFVLIYGVFFAGLLALVYFPIHLTLIQVSERLRDEFAPLPPLGDEKWAEAWRHRETLENAVSIKVGASSSFKAGVAIITPLLGSLKGLLLNAG